MRLDKLRGWLSVNLAPVVFLVAYFLTVVLGNFMYLLPSARPYLDMAPYTARIFELDTLFSLGFWVLLLSPFVVTPLVVWMVRKLLQRPVARVVAFFPDFTRGSYLFLLLLCYALVICAFWRADAFSLFIAGGDFTSSVEARFEIRERISFLNMALLMSNLHFLSIYGVVQRVRWGGRFWACVTLLNVVLISALLVFLNMKWPIIIFYAGLVMALFVYTARHAFLKASLGMVFLLLVYFSISAFVYRISAVDAVPDRAEDVPVLSEGAVDVAPHMPPVVEKQWRTPGNEGKTEVIAPAPAVSGDNVAVAQPLPSTGKGGLEKVVSLGVAVGEHVPMMVFHAVNRMAIIYPYYYDVFTNKGQVCGGLAAQLRVGQKCRPSFMIYNVMFDDQFQGRGTAPAPVHVTAYALGGWSLAAVGLVCASILLGLFASLPLRENALVGAMAITGGVVGYHLSQLPGEGPIFYDHGLFWTLLMLFGYAVLVKVYRRVAG